jgi:polyferredoxin
MTPSTGLSPLILSKFVLWIAVVTGTTILLMRHKLSQRARLAVVIGGTLVFGFLYGILLKSSPLNPNPVASLRTVLTGALVQHKIAPPLVGMLAVLLIISWVSNKSLCGNGCQLGLLQDLLYRVPVPKWQPPFKISNMVRVVAFVSLIGSLLIAGLDWIGIIDPFQLFQFKFTWPIALSSGAILLTSLFIYRPWCRFLCPFGLVSWGVEQVSLLHPRIDQDACKRCQACVRACPSGAMQDFYDGKTIHRDCFACGACIEACPVEDALGWRK